MKTQNQPPLSKYQIRGFLPEHLITRNLVAFAIDDKNNLYAIKFSTSAQLQNEFELMNRINHPCIIPAVDFIETNHFLGIVMPQAQGGDLLEFYFSHYFLESEVRQIMLSLFSAVDYLHAYGIIHRDIKFENIFIKGKGLSTGIFLADLELATFDEISIGQVGSYQYMSPEMINGEQYNFKTDIWSLGVVMYTLLYRRYPFNGNFANPINFDVSTNVAVSAEAKNLICHLLCLNPDDRYTAKQALDHDWSKADLTYNDVCNVANRYENEINGIMNVRHEEVAT